VKRLLDNLCNALALPSQASATAVYDSDPQREVVLPVQPAQGNPAPLSQAAAGRVGEESS